MDGPSDERVGSLERKRIGASKVAAAVYDEKHGTVVVVLENGRTFRLASGGDEGIVWWQWRWEENDPVPGTQASALSRRADDVEETDDEGSRR